MHETVRIVSLRKLVQIELTGFGLSVGVLHSILDIPIEDAPSSRNRVHFTRSMSHYFCNSAETLAKALHLKSFTSTNLISVTIGLTVDITKCHRFRGRVSKRFGCMSLKVI